MAAMKPPLRRRLWGQRSIIQQSWSEGFRLGRHFQEGNIRPNSETSREAGPGTLPREHVLPTPLETETTKPKIGGRMETVSRTTIPVRLLVFRGHREVLPATLSAEHGAAAWLDAV